MCLVLLLVVFGIAAYRHGEFKITSRRMVTGETSRVLGVMMLVAAGLALIPNSWLGLLTFLLVIVIGLVSSKPIPK